MADHIRSKTADDAEIEKWRLAPKTALKNRDPLTVEGEAICNIMGQHHRYLLERIIALEAKVGKLDKAGHAE